MAANEQEWNVHAPEGVCSGCGREFADQEEFSSQLIFVPESGYLRRDCCPNCRPGAAGGVAVSIWKTRYHAKPPPSEEPLKKETAESLLRQLLEKNEPADRNIVYVLAVMLERRRILVERDVQVLETGEHRRIYEHRATGEIWVIADPQLRLSDLEKVQTEVVLRLGGKAPGARTNSEAPAADTTVAETPPASP